LNIDLFNQLGDEIEQRWLAANYSEYEFPAIAKQALVEFDLPSKTTPWEAVEWALSVRELPPQRDLGARFAQPPVTLYQGPRFHIDIYFWFNSTTALHQHAFCGAFQVFEGSSLHSWYEFERYEAVNLFTETGRLSLKVCQILEKGMTQEIWHGRQYIHSLFHLDEPSTTIVVRTHRSPLELPQYNYHKPGLAIDPFYDEDTATKKRQIVMALLQARRPEADDLIAKLLNESDFQTSFALLTNLKPALSNDHIGRTFGVDTGSERFDRFLEIVEKRHGRTAEILRPVLDYMDRQGQLIEKRRFVSEAEHRFLFALLLNIDDREHILELIRGRYPDEDAVEKVLDWLFDLSQTRVIGQEKSVLGFDLGAAEMFALEGLLRGKPDDEIAAEFALESNGTDPELIQTALATIRSATTLRPLLT
jgi:hypothetical protein